MNNKDTNTEKFSFENTEVAFTDKSDIELKESYWMFKLLNNGLLVNIGSRFTSIALKLRLPIKSAVKATIFKFFVGGETIEEAVPKIKNLERHGITTILDYGVEAKNSEFDYDRTMEENLKAIAFAAEYKSVKFLSCKITGLGRFALFEKAHADENSLTSIEQRELERVADRVKQLCAAAKKHEIALFFDAEESWIQKPLDKIIQKMMAEYNREEVLFYNTYQMYLSARWAELQEDFEYAIANGFKLGVKLVRGAYMEKEAAYAKKKRQPSPIHSSKAEVNIDYDKALDFSVKNIENIALCVATHNEASCLHLLKEIEAAKIPKDHPHLLFAQLFGMGENITFNLANHGYKASKLVPFGPVRDVIPYLIRRAHENSAAEGQMSRELSLLNKEIERRLIFKI